MLEYARELLAQLIKSLMPEKHPADSLPDNSFFALQVDADGNFLSFSKEKHLNPKKPFEIDIDELEATLGAKEFVIRIIELLSNNKDRFFGELDFDVFPLLLIWHPDGAMSGCLSILDQNVGHMTVSYISKNSGRNR